MYSVDGVDKPTILPEQYMGDALQPEAGDSTIEVTAEDAPHRFMAKGVSGKALFSLRGDNAAVAVVAPAKGKVTHRGKRSRGNDVIVDHRTGAD